MKYEWCPPKWIIFVIVSIFIDFSGAGTDDDEMTMEIEFEPSASFSLPGAHPPLPSPDDIVEVEQGLGELGCTEQSCVNSGICREKRKEKGGRFFCLCPLGFMGPRCWQRSIGTKFPELLDGGYLAFNMWPTISLKSQTAETPLKFDVRLQIKSKILRPQTVLFYHKSPLFKHTFHVELANNILQLRLYNSSKFDKASLSLILQHPIPLKDVFSHFYKIGFGLRIPNEVYLELEGHEISGRLDYSISIEGFHQYLQSSNKHKSEDEFVYIGGHPKITRGTFLGSSIPTLGTSHRSFVGQLGELRINGRLLDPRRAAFVGDAVGGYGIVDYGKMLCEESQCQLGAACRPISPTNNICLCPLGSQPPLCKQGPLPLIPEFLGNSFIAVAGMRGSSLTDTIIELVFQPRLPTGLLLYAGQSMDRRGDFVMLVLLDGRVVIVFDLGTGPAQQRSPASISMNTWHSVEVCRVGRAFLLTVDGQPMEMESFTQGSFIQLTIADNLYVGGHPNPDHISGLPFPPDANPIFSYMRVVGFTGSIQSLLVNGKSIDLLHQAVHAVNIANNNEHVCGSSVNFCSPFGTCVPQGQLSSCLCELGHIGPYCKTEVDKKSLQWMSFDGSSHLLFTDNKILKQLSLSRFSITMMLQLGVGSITVNTSITSFLQNDIENEVAGRVLLLLQSNNMGKSIQVVLQILPDRSLLLEVCEMGTFGEHLISATRSNRQTSRTSTKLTDGKVHLLTLTRLHDVYSLLVNDEPVSQVNHRQDIPRLYVFSELYIGGLNTYMTDQRVYMEKISALSVRRKASVQTTLIRRKGFQGCLGKIRIGETSVDAIDATAGKNIGLCTTT